MRLFYMFLDFMLGHKYFIIYEITFKNQHLVTGNHVTQHKLNLNDYYLIKKLPNCLIDYASKEARYNKEGAILQIKNIIKL